MYWRARGAGYPPAYVGENVAWGTVGRTAAEAFNDLVGSVGHEEPVDGRLISMGLAYYTRADTNEYACGQVMAGPP